jgi:DNA-binding transcriptional LysR family regulator
VVDCGFVTSAIKHVEPAAERLYNEEILLVVSAKLPRPRRVQLESVPLIMFAEHSGFRRYLDRAFAAAGALVSFLATMRKHAL